MTRTPTLGHGAAGAITGEGASVQNMSENDRDIFWLTMYAGLAVSLLVFAITGRFVP